MATYMGRCRYKLFWELLFALHFPRLPKCPMRQLKYVGHRIMYNFPVYFGNTEVWRWDGDLVTVRMKHFCIERMNGSEKIQINNSWSNERKAGENDSEYQASGFWWQKQESITFRNTERDRVWAYQDKNSFCFVCFISPEFQPFWSKICYNRSSGFKRIRIYLP